MTSERYSSPPIKETHDRQHLHNIPRLFVNVLSENGHFEVHILLVPTKLYIVVRKQDYNMCYLSQPIIIGIYCYISSHYLIIFQHLFQSVLILLILCFKLSLKIFDQQIRVDTLYPTDLGEHKNTSTVLMSPKKNILFCI